MTRHPDFGSSVRALVPFQLQSIHRPLAPTGSEVKSVAPSLSTSASLSVLYVCRSRSDVTLCSVCDDRRVAAIPWNSAQTDKTVSRAIYHVNWEEKTFLQHFCTTIDVEDSPEWLCLSRRGRGEKRQEFPFHPPRILQISKASTNCEAPSTTGQEPRRGFAYPCGSPPKVLCSAPCTTLR